MITGALAIALAGVPPAALSIEDAERMAVQHSDEVRIARNAMRSAWARSDAVASNGRPQLALTGSASRFDNKTTVSMGGQSFEMLPDHMEDASLQLVQVLDASNQIGTAYAQARLAALAQAYGLAAKISDQILSAETIFLSVLRAKEGVKVAQASLDAYRVQLRTATELWKGGVGLRIDVDRATSQVASAERDLVQRQNDLNMARAALNDQIGEPLDAEPELTDVPAPAGILGTPRSSERAELLSQAARQRSEARSAELGVKAAEKGIKLARSSTDPTVSLALAGNYYPTTSFSYPRPSTGTLSLNVSIPIYDGGLARARVDDARAALETAKAQANAVRRAISLQAQDAFLDVDTAQKSLAAAEEALKAAVAARELARQRYEGQVGLYLEVTDAQAALTAAQTGRVNALYDLFIAKARLQRALGDLTLPSQPAAKP